MSKNWTGKVSKRLVYTRENRIIPWSWIVDETHSAETISTWKATSPLIQRAFSGYNGINDISLTEQKYGVIFGAMHG